MYYSACMTELISKDCHFTLYKLNCNDIQALIILDVYVYRSCVIVMTVACY